VGDSVFTRGENKREKGEGECFHGGARYLRHR
jgi:hypothetical protein